MRTNRDAALKLFVVLNRTVAALRQHAEADVARHGLTVVEFAVMEALYHRGDMPLGDLQKRILVTSGGMTYLVDRLAEQGYVERRPCETDRRVRYASLTPQGRQLMAAIFPAHAEALERAMAGLTLDQKREAVALLRELGTYAAENAPDQ
ncbi:MAG TPA: MarR family transcriptional regulator [Longimicrobiales bacterium]|nr:MarR family transcriptional regulator [Longimicrobiales bacterium]